MKKLAVFMPSLNGGGAERVTLLLINELAERGHTVDLLVANGNGVYRKQVHEAINVIDFNKSRVAACFLPLVQYLRKTKPNSLLSVMNYTNVIAALAVKSSFTNSRLVLTEHNNAEQALKNTESFKYEVVNWLTKSLYKCADAIICVSNGVADSITKVLDIPRDRLSVVYNPVIHPGVKFAAEEPISHHFLSEKHAKLLLAVGRLTAQKNFENLLKAFKLVSEQTPVKLVILGEGEEHAKLTQLATSLGIEDKICMPGFVENPYAWMKQADVFVLSSSWEGLPTVLIEALACGAKVVSTDCPSGPREILDNGRWGQLVEMDNPNALSVGILKALSSPTISAIDKHLDLFSIEFATSCYEKILIGND